MADTSLTVHAPLARHLADAVLNLAGRVPASSLEPSAEPALQARALAASACRKAAAVSAGLAIPAGPWGLLTVVPDLVIIWELQAQMVADIAAVYGQSASLGREHMLWCLFKHTGAQALRDLAVRSGERWLVKKASLSMLQSAAQMVGLQLTQRAIGRGALRVVPVIGAAGVGLYAYRDTHGVAKAAIDLFSRMAPSASEPVAA